MKLLKYTVYSLLLITVLSCKQKANIKTNTVEDTVSDIKIQNQEDLKQKDLDIKPAIIEHYICYTNNDKKDMRIWISFSKEKAIQIKYNGQQDAIDLIFDKETYIKGGSHPTIIKYYNEIYNDKVNGIYKLTHSGNWDYVEYTRGKDSKIFNFTIDHNANPYGKTPCF
ncbi:hypothetical protein [uncultured Lacinutrix sp.]|uniref:hypothetical protein n=1 Tax=uncultured Lacinutrix sp. TaxID=574032 RepID=UPI002628360D|nr:hypothetical protein [uncultured Lacinutrix sp.]